MRKFLSTITLGVSQILIILMTVLNHNREIRPKTGAVHMSHEIMSQIEADPMEIMTIGGRTNIPRIWRGMTPIEAVVEGAEVHPPENIHPVDSKTMALQLLLITS